MLKRKNDGIMAFEQAPLNRCAYSFLIGHMGMLYIL